MKKYFCDCLSEKDQTCYLPFVCVHAAKEGVGHFNFTPFYVDLTTQD